MTADLAEFLRARLDEEETRARLISGGGGFEPQLWAINREEASRGGRDEADAVSYSPVYAFDRGLGEPMEQDARCDENPVALAQWGRNEDMHIAYWDPRRVVADVQAKRSLVDLHRPDQYYPSDCAACRREEPGWSYGVPDEWPCPTLRLLAVPFAGHPEYQHRWRP